MPRCPSCCGCGREGHGENCGCCGGSGEIPDSYKRYLDVKNGRIPVCAQTDDELLDRLQYVGFDRWLEQRIKDEIRRRLARRHDNESPSTMEVSSRRCNDRSG